MCELLKRPDAQQRHIIRLGRHFPLLYKVLQENRRHLYTMNIFTGTVRVIDKEVIT